MRRLDIPTPRVFLPLLGNHQFKGAKGGRGGAKSHFFAGLGIEEMYSRHTRAAFVREVQNSIKDSVKQLLEDKINAFGLANEFQITEREIVCPRTESLAIFRGLQNHTAASIKSLEGFNRVHYEEAQTLTQRSLDLAIPTFRAPNSQQWFSWNPDLAKDPVDTLFRVNKDDPDFKCVHVNYYNNPWFPAELRRMMERDKARDPDKYAHIWLGDYRRNSEARVFRNFKIAEFDDPPKSTVILGGGDWGFSQDPTVLILCFIVGRTLYIWREVWAVGCEIDRTPALFDRIDPEWTAERARDPNWRSIARRVPSTVDSARPETISYMMRAGFPRMKAAIKGVGSVEDGIEFLKSYDIVIHPRCTHTAEEFAIYSYKIDKRTNEITSEVEDKNNHTIDACRYAVEDVRRRPVSSVSELNI